MRRRPPHRPARSHAFRARIEALEGRQLLTLATVTKVTDDGSVGTLRWAIDQINMDSGGGQDQIAFSIEGLGAHTIKLNGSLSALTHAVFIDGTTQSGYGGAPLISLDAGYAFEPTFAVQASGCQIQGLAIINNGGSAIRLAGNDEVIRANYLGIDPNGTPGGNAGDGITVSGSSRDLIGGVNPADRNVIAANSFAGISITDSSSIRVQGNFIGTNPANFLALPNAQSGVAISGVSSGDVVLNNVISGNGGYGILLSGGNVSGVRIQANAIGTDLAGTTAVGNAAGGISAVNATGTVILGNEISGNGGPGVSITGLTALGGTIQGNIIGTDRGGSSPLGNAGPGVMVGAQAQGIAIGGTVAGQGNVIADNGSGSSGPGVLVGSGSAGCPILENAIFGNAGLGIALQGSGSSGGNRGQAAPSLGQATAGRYQTIVQGTLQAAANTAYRIEFFSNPQADPSGSGQGRTYLGAAAVRTDGAGNAAYTATVPTGSARGVAISATATDPAGNTSQFAQDVAAAPGPPADLGVSITPSATTSTALQPLTYTLVVTNNGPNPATGIVLNDTLPAGLSGYTVSTSQGQVAQGANAFSVALGNLAVNAAATITLTVTPTQAGTATDSAGVSGDGADPASANDSASSSVAIRPAPADLQVSITLSTPGRATVGEPLTYTVDVTNLGPGPATGVGLADTLPANAQLLAYQTNLGTVTQNGNVLNVSGVTLANGTTLVFQVTVRPTAAGAVIDAASASAGTTDPVPGNNRASSSVTAVQPPDHLKLTIAAAPNPATAGQPLTYTLTVTNLGPVVATGVVVGDTLPGNATFGTATTTQGGTTLSGATLTAAIGTLGVGGVATVTITVTPTQAGPLADQAVVSADQPESVPGDEAAGVQVPVGLAGTLQFGAPTFAGPENAGVATITVTRINGSGGTVTVHYATADGTAAAGVNYLATAGDLTFGPGVTSQTFTVPVIDDHRLDGDHTVNLTLSAPANGAVLGGQAGASLTVGESDRPGAFQVAAAAVRVNEHGGLATITVDRVGGSDVPATVSFATAPYGAVAGLDYLATSGTLAFNVGETSKTFAIPVIDRGAAGLTPRSLFAYLTGPAGGATLGAAVASLVTIAPESTPGDYAGVGQTAVGVYDPTGPAPAFHYTVSGSPVVRPFGFAGHGNIPLTGDYDGEGKTDVGIYDPTTATFAFVESGTGRLVVQAFGFVGHGNIPLAGDYDGTGRTNIGIYDSKSATFAYISTATGRVMVTPFGFVGHGNIPLNGDFDGSGRSEIGIYDPTVANFAFISARTGRVVVRHLGTVGHGDIPLAGDYDGDGIADLGLYDPRTSTFAYISSRTGREVDKPFGTPGHGDTPLAGDYDGDGRTDLGIYDPTASTFAFIASGAGQVTIRPLANPSRHPFQPVPTPVLPASIHYQSRPAARAVAPAPRPESALINGPKPSR